jgi:WD40 repeat protein
MCRPVGRLAPLALLVFLFPPAAALAETAPPARPRVDRDGVPLPEGALARLGTARLRNLGYFGAVALSPDGAALCSAQAGAVRFLDPRTGEEQGRLEVPGGASGVLFSADGKILITAGSDGTLRFWDAKAKREVRKLLDPDNRGAALSVSADGNTVATCRRAFGEGKQLPVLVFDARSGKRLASVEPMHKANQSAVLSPDGKALVTWGAAGFGKLAEAERARLNEALQLWSVKTGKETARALTGRGHSTIEQAAFSPDGKELAAATNDAALHFFDASTGARRRTVLGVSSAGRGALTYSPDGKLLVLGTSDGRFLVWEAATGKRFSSTDPPLSCQFLAVCFPPGGGVLAAGAVRQMTVVWDVRTGRQISRPGGHTSPVLSVGFTRYGQRVRTVAQDGAVLTWDLRGNERGRQEAPMLDGWSSWRWYGSRLFSPDLRYLASSSNSTGAMPGLTLRELSTGNDVLVGRFDTFGGSLQAFSPDGTLLAVANTGAFGRKTAVHLFNAATGEELPVIPLGSKPTGLALAPDRRHVAVGMQAAAGKRGAGLEVRLYEVATGKESATFKPVQVPGSVWRSALAFSPDRRSLVVEASNATLHFVDARTGAASHQFSLGGWLQAGPVFSPDGRLVAVASPWEFKGEATVSLWEVKTGRKLGGVGVPREGTKALAFSQDGKALASAHQDTTVLVWDVEGLLAGPAGKRPKAGEER